MIQDYINRKGLNQNDKLFKGDSANYGKSYRHHRNKLAKKLKDATIQTIRLYDFRHYFATMLYHKTKDILYVKQQMGHRKIETTLIYTQLLQFEQNDNYTCKVAEDTKQATELIEVGFEYITGEYSDGGKIFRKRK
jgi:integrase